MSQRKERSYSTKSVEYRSVLLNLPSIIAVLQANRPAGESLSLKLKQKEWISVTADPPPQELMKVVLNRIKDDANQFHVFMDCLSRTAGLDLIKKQIEETSSELPISMACIKIPYKHGVCLLSLFILNNRVQLHYSLNMSVGSRQQ